MRAPCLVIVLAALTAFLLGDEASGDVVAEWVARHDCDGGGHDDARAIVTDAVGNVYVTGGLWDEGKFVDCLTVKYDALGTEVWRARYDGSGGDTQERGRVIALDDSGNVYVAARGASGLNQTCYVTIKYDATGVEQWVARYLVGTGNYANDIVVDGEANVYVTGQSYLYPGGTDFATIKYDTDGNEIWAARYDSPGTSWDQDIARAIALDDSGNVYVTGGSRADQLLDAEFTTVKYDRDGNEQWVASYPGGPDEAGGCAVVTDSLGYVYVTGWHRWAFFNWDYVVIKYNGAGGEEWVSRFSGGGLEDRAYAIALDDERNVYVTGVCGGDAVGYDLVTVKFDTNGIEQWNARYDGPGAGVDRGRDLAVGPDGFLYVCGESDGVGTGLDYVVIRYDLDGGEQWVSRYDGPDGEDDHCASLAVDASGGVRVAGESMGLLGGFDYTTVCYDPAGEEAWVARIDGEDVGWDWGHALAIDGHGNVIVTGQCNNAGNVTDCVTIKYGPGGVREWMARYDGPGNDMDKGLAVTVDDVGNVYVAGASWGGEEPPDDTGHDFLTIKYGPDGAEKWVARYNGPQTSPYNSGDHANSVAVDSDGNVYVTGRSYGGGQGHHDDFLTVKYDSLGGELWVARYNGPGGGDDHAHGIALDEEGNVYVTGAEHIETRDHDAFTTVKYDADGHEEWASVYSGGGGIGSIDGGRTVAVGPDGYVYATGRLWGPNGYDYTTIKYEPLTGGREWIEIYDGPGHGDDEVTGLVMDAAGNIYVTGLSEGDTTGYDYATVKYDSDGNELWVARYAGLGLADSSDIAYAIAVDFEGGVCVTGESSDGLGSSDYATVGYDSTGNELWVVRYDGPGHGEDRASDIGIDDGGNVYVTGRSWGSDTERDWATIKYATVTGVAEDDDGSPPGIELRPAAPNPFALETSICFDVPVAVRSGRIRIYNVRGQLVRVLFEGALPPGRHARAWNGRDDRGDRVAAGVYFVRLDADGEADVSKLVLLQ